MRAFSESEETRPSTRSPLAAGLPAAPETSWRRVVLALVALLGLPGVWWAWPTLGTEVQRALAVVLAALGLAALAVVRPRRAGAARASVEVAAAAPPATGDVGPQRAEVLLTAGQALRATVTDLSGQLALALDGGTAAMQHEARRAAIDATDRLQRLLTDLIDAAQLAVHRWPVRPTRQSPRGLLLDVQGEMRALAARRGVQLRIQVDPDAPAWVMLDGVRVRQLLLNLVQPAVRAQGAGGVTLSLRECRHGPMPTLCFEVRGEGLTDHLPAGLLSATDRVGPAGSAADPSDLGLHLAADLARALGGGLAAHDADGEVFWRLELPRVLADAPEPAAAAGPARTEAALSSLKVLVAEDHDVNRQYIAAVLDSLGHQASFAGDGLEAVAAADRDDFDVVLMDLHMPGCDGVEATRRIRASPDARRAAVPIVALTADSALDVRDQCLLAGMNDFLVKPVTAAAMQSCLRRLFGATPRPEADSASIDVDLPLPWVVHSFVLDTGVINAALQTMGEDRLAGMFQSFFGDAPQRLERLRAAVRQGQPDALRVEAQALRGAALNLGLVALAGTAGALHDGAPVQAAHEIALLIQRLEDRLRDSRQALASAGLMPAA